MNNKVPPGLIQPTMTSYTPGAGNPRESAMMAGQNANARQASLNNSVGGRKRRKYRGGQLQTSVVAIPQFPMPYTATGGPGSDPNSQIAATSSTSMQSAAWAANDNLATKTGGSRRKRRGGNPDWVWGCYSGGKKRTSRGKSMKYKNKKTTKTRKYRRH